MISVEETTTSEPWADDQTTTNLPRVPVIPDEFKGGAPELKKIYKGLGYLLWQMDNDDDPPISAAAVDTAIALLQSTAYLLQQSSMPSGTVTTEGSGGVRIEWWRGDYCVILAVKADRDKYIFCKLPDDGRGVVRRPVYSEQLAAHLKSLAQLADAPNE